MIESRRLGKLLLFIAAFSLYAFNFGRTLDFDFVWDDRANIAHDENILEGDLVQALSFRQSDLSEQRNHHDKPNFASNLSYRPLQFLSYWLDFHLFGRDAKTMHFHGLFLGLLLLFLFWSIGARLLNSPIWAAASLLILVAHPLLIEPVVYISARSDLLLANCCLSCIRIGLLDTTGKRRSLPWVGVFGCGFFYFAALCSKESAVFLPVVILPILYFGAAKKITSLSFAMLTGLAVYLCMRFYFLPHEFRPFHLESFVDLPAVVLDYFRVLILPVNISITRVLATPIFVGWVFFALLTGLFTASVFSTPQRRRQIHLSCLTFMSLFVVIAPGSEHMHLFPALADRYALIPLCIFTWSMVLLLKEAWPAITLQGRKFFIAFVSVWTLFLVVKSVGAIPAWKNQKTLFVHNLISNPDSAMAYSYAASLFTEQNQCDQAIPLLEKALEIDPHHAGALFSLGDCELQRNNPSKANEYFDRLDDSKVTLQTGEVLIKRAKAKFATADASKGCLLVFRAWRLNPDHPEIKSLWLLNCRNFDPKKEGLQ